jgi:negative regulator of sigma-B (phosphoserine phosphatase)
MVLHGGIVGYRLPPLRPTSVLVTPGDVLILATDGVRSDVDPPPDLSGSPKEIALRILADGNKETDDALVLVTRYLGDSR